MNTRVIDLSGKVFGKLTVVSYYSTIKARSHWLCKCSCGRETVVASNNLRHNKTNYCGKCTKLEHDEALSRIIYRDYRFRAKKDGLDFSLTLSQVAKFIRDNCHYCGTVPANTKTRRNRTLVYNGIDRIDSKKGYTVLNCRTSCGMCNIMKMDHTEEEFKNQINKIALNWAGK